MGDGEDGASRQGAQADGVERAVAIARGAAAGGEEAGQGGEVGIGRRTERASTGIAGNGSRIGEEGRVQVTRAVVVLRRTNIEAEVAGIVEVGADGATAIEARGAERGIEGIAALIGGLHKHAVGGRCHRAAGQGRDDRAGRAAGHQELSEGVCHWSCSTCAAGEIRREGVRANRVPDFFDSYFNDLKGISQKAWRKCKLQRQPSGPVPAETSLSAPPHNPR